MEVEEVSISSSKMKVEEASISRIEGEERYLTLKVQEASIFRANKDESSTSSSSTHGEENATPSIEVLIQEGIQI